jgi:hypothetical protein
MMYEGIISPNTVLASAMSGRSFLLQDKHDVRGDHIPEHRIGLGKVGKRLPSYRTSMM